MNAYFSRLPKDADSEYGYAEFGVTGFNGQLLMGYGMGAGIGLATIGDGLRPEFVIGTAYKLARRIGYMCSGTDTDGTRSKFLKSAHNSMTARLKAMEKGGWDYEAESAEAADRFPVQKKGAKKFIGNMDGWMDLCIGSVSRGSAEQNLGLIVVLPEQYNGPDAPKTDRYRNIYALYSDFESSYLHCVYSRLLSDMVDAVLKEMHEDDAVYECVRSQRPGLSEEDDDFKDLIRDVSRSVELLVARQACFMVFTETLLELGCEPEGKGQWKLNINDLFGLGMLTEMGLYRTHLVIDCMQQPISYPYMIYKCLDPMFGNPCEKVGSGTSCHNRTLMMIMVRMNGSLKNTLNGIDSRFLRLTDTVVVNDMLMMDAGDGMFREEVCKTVGHKVKVLRAALKSGSHSRFVDLELDSGQSVVPRNDMLPEELQKIIPPVINCVIGAKCENESKGGSMTA